METVSPNLYVHNLHETITFYQLLGFKLITTVPETGDPIFALMMNGEVTFMFQTFASIEGTLPVISRAGGGAVLLYVKMKGVRDFYEDVKDKVAVLQGLKTTFYGATEFSIKDNNDFMITFAEDE